MIFPSELNLHLGRGFSSYPEFDYKSVTILSLVMYPIKSIYRIKSYLIDIP